MQYLYKKFLPSLLFLDAVTLPRYWYFHRDVTFGEAAFFGGGGGEGVAKTYTK